MRIGLIDVDGHNFPNLPLMKISAYHKAKGDSVAWYHQMFSERQDIVYMSKVFGFTPDFPYYINAEKVIKGGSGYCIETINGKEVYAKSKDHELPYEIEHTYPDYSLYPQATKDTAYGFLTRGCPRGCEFCHVEAKEGNKSYKVADLKEFWNGQKNITLCDPNILACPDRVELLTQLRDSGAKVNFNQGLDIRLINEECMALLKQISVSMFHFAYDRWKDKEIVESKLRWFVKETGYDRHKVEVFILTNFDTTVEQDIHRIQFCREIGIQPYVMIYDKEHADPIYKRLQRWCNPFIFRKALTFEDYLRGTGK